jgi:hypothetical protein
MAVSFIGGGNRSTQRKTMDLSQITDKLCFFSSVNSNFLPVPSQDLDFQRHIHMLWYFFFIMLNKLQRKTMDLSQITDKLYHITYQKYGKRFYHGKHEDFEIESLVALTYTKSKLRNTYLVLI